MPQRNLSPKRRGAYYSGMILTGIGVLLFLSAFVGFLFLFGDSDSPQSGFSEFSDHVQTIMVRGFGGIVCIAFGQGIMRVGKEGISGSGLKLDPQEARKDREPWSRMSGGMLKDTLDEAGIHLSRPSDNMPFDEQLRRLEGLKQEGILSEAEYATAKNKILQSLGKST